MPMMMNRRGPPPPPPSREMNDEDAFYSSKSEAEPRSVDEEEAASPTALLPLSALGAGVREGDTVTVRVVKVYDDEAEVEVASGETKPPPPPPSGGEPPADDELSAMDEGE